MCIRDRFSPSAYLPFAEVVSVEETEGSHISSDRQWKKLVSKLLAHQVLSTLLYAVKELEVRLRGSSPEMATMGGCLLCTGKGYSLEVDSDLPYRDCRFAELLSY